MIADLGEKIALAILVIIAIGSIAGPVAILVAGLRMPPAPTLPPPPSLRRPTGKGPIGQVGASPTGQVRGDMRDRVNSASWAGLPPGTVQFTDVTVAGPGWLRRLWLRLAGRKPAFVVTYTFSATPGRRA